MALYDTKNTLQGVNNKLIYFEKSQLTKCKLYR
jgi:hypothetical protein